jgi:CRP-like cAMP-binding protein
MVAVAADLPMTIATPSADTFDAGEYEITIPVDAPTDAYGALSEFRRRLWYAARRAGLHLDRDYYVEYDSTERRRAMLTRFSSALYCSPDELHRYVDSVRVERYVAGEKLQHPGEVPDGIRLIDSGIAHMIVEGPEGVRVPVTDLTRDEIVGLTSLTRQGINATVQAITEMTVLAVPVDVLDVLVAARPELARDFGREIDNRRRLVRDAFTKAGLDMPLGKRSIAY